MYGAAIVNFRYFWDLEQKKIFFLFQMTKIF